jgi:sortase (surface protein transpeptidase)
MHERHVNDSAFRGRMRSYAPGGSKAAMSTRPVFRSPNPVINKKITPTRSIDGISAQRPISAPLQQQIAMSQGVNSQSQRPDRTHHKPAHARSFVVPKQHRSAVLQRQSVRKSAYEIHKATRRRRINPIYVFVLSASVFVIGIGAIGYAAWMVKNSKGQVAGAHTGKEEANKSNPFEAPPSVDDYKNHTVPSDLPRYVRIPGLRINARAKQVGYEQSTGLETPHNIYDIGWYGQSGRPNDTKAMVLSVRTRGKTKDSPYTGLDKLKPGNFIEVEQGDGHKLFYKVVSSSPVEPGKFTMTIASTSADSKRQGLNIISYSPTGPDSGAYEPTLIVYAIRM